MGLYGALPYFTKEPRYECFNNVTKVKYCCSPADFCGNPDITFKIDYSYKNSYDNMIKQAGLECMPHLTMGFIGSAFMLGFAISLLVLPRI